jgi:hypothetical protein
MSLNLNKTNKSSLHVTEQLKADFVEAGKKMVNIGYDIYRMTTWTIEWPSWREIRKTSFWEIPKAAKKFVPKISRGFSYAKFKEFILLDGTIFKASGLEIPPEKENDGKIRQEAIEQFTKAWAGLEDVAKEFKTDIQNLLEFPPSVRNSRIDTFKEAEKVMQGVGFKNTTTLMQKLSVKDLQRFLDLTNEIKQYFNENAKSTASQRREGLHDFVRTWREVKAFKMNVRALLKPLKIIPAPSPT